MEEKPMSERRSVDVPIGTPKSRDEQEACVAAVGFKCDLLWAQLDALQHAYAEAGHIPPGAFVPQVK
jgi:pyrroloquinoline-quinone synthase